MRSSCSGLNDGSDLPHFTFLCRQSLNAPSFCVIPVSPAVLRFQCAIAEMAAASYGYAYVTEAGDFAALSSYWETLVSETSVSPPPPPNGSRSPFR